MSLLTDYQVITTNDNELICSQSKLLCNISIIYHNDNSTKSKFKTSLNLKTFNSMTGINSYKSIHVTNYDLQYVFSDLHFSESLP